MKKIYALIIALFIPFAAVSAEFEEGKHYVKVQGLAAKSPEVREYFSFYCPHCYQAEHLMALVKKTLPEGVTFVRNHVNFLGGRSKKMQSLFSQALVVAQELDVEQQQVDALFKYIHQYRAVPTSAKDLRNVFVLSGIDGEKFDQLMNDEKVIKKAQEMEAHQNALAETKGITGVPAVIVNGKYRIQNSGFKGLTHEEFEQAYPKLIEHLLAL